MLCVCSGYAVSSIKTDASLGCQMKRTALLNRFFTLLYTDLWWLYDIAAWIASGGMWYEWVRTAADFVNAPPVLEVGFGRGHLLLHLHQQGIPVVGVDRSPQMVRAAQQALRRQSIDIPLVQADGRALPFPDATFGTLMTTFPAPYVQEARTQHEFARVLRHEGQWICLDTAFGAHRWTMRLWPATLLYTLAGWPTSKAKGVTSSSITPAFVSPHLFDCQVVLVPVRDTRVRVLLCKRRLA